MARRDLGRHRVRAVLTCVLVMLPVLVATLAALGEHNGRWDAEHQARDEMGVADAQALVSPFAAVRPRQALQLTAVPAEHTQRDGKRVPVRRDRGEVDLEQLLPSGSEIAAVEDRGSVSLATGGSGYALVVPDSPLVRPWVGLEAGRFPAAADEVALTEPVADELGLLFEGEPTEDAELELADGSAVRVVGVVDPADRYRLGAMTIIAPPGSVVRPESARHVRYLVDLPELTRGELEQLVADAAAAGVLLQPRDVILHPERWGLPADREVVDVEALVAGAMVVLVGMLEVVLLVGAAFAVAARRQVRDLGLLAANGGAASDVRRVLLAQGLVLGVGSSLVGVVAGIVAFRGLGPLWASLFGLPTWRQEVPWPAVAVVLVLGSLSAVVAALLPGWSIARLTPVAALSGRFPVRSGEARAHRGAVALAASGLLLLALGGWTTARTFGPGGTEVTLAPFVAGLGLLLLVAGTVWATPYVVRRLAGLGRLLPLSGRYAFRDAARHRFRTAAAVVALSVTVAGAVLAGFAFKSTARAAEGYLPPQTLELYVAGLAGEPDTGRRERLEETVESVVGPVTMFEAVSVVGGGRVDVTVRGSSVRTVDEETLVALGADDDVLEQFRAGAAVRIGRAANDEAVLVVRRPGADRRVTVPLIGTTTTGEAHGLANALGRVFVSEGTARKAGLRYGERTLVAQATRPVTGGDVERLAVHGVSAWSEDPHRTAVSRMQFAGLGIAALLSLLVVGVAVGLAAAESRDEVATLSAVGAGPWRRRGFGAMHGLFLGGVSVVLGVAVGVPAGMAFTQVDGLPGIDMAWLASGGTAVTVLLAAPLVGWLVTPSRLRLTRRVA